MEDYSSRKNEIIQLNQDILNLFVIARKVPGIAADSFENWEKTCRRIQKQLDQEVIRIAVVGSIKSGKSTLLNSIFKGDYLKRGAGVVTSIVTRIRGGQKLRARLIFKSWDEINGDMNRALVLFPNLSWRSADSRFDIRRAAERAELQTALQALNPEQLITRDARNINNVLLSSYLKGYDLLANVISERPVTLQYDNARFSEHKTFVGSEILAAYLRDVRLEINSGGLQRNVEIADCQGADSSNPLHLAMIQDYLALAHLIIYVVSSRTGLRRADIRFLSLIKKMGILDNTLFVINCDFSEHESIADLNSLVRRVREELSLIRPEPEIYTFSALFNLFNAPDIRLADRDRSRLQQWKGRRELADFSLRETERFEAALQARLTRKRDQLLLRNHFERLGIILDGCTGWIGIHRQLVARDADGCRKILEQISDHRQRLGRIEFGIKNAIEGALPKIKNDLSGQVNRFFDAHTGAAPKAIGAFINEYHRPAAPSGSTPSSNAFSQALYQVFQEFKQSLDVFISETVYPEVIRFIQSQEEKIRQHFDALLEPYNAMLDDACREYSRLMVKWGADVRMQNQAAAGLPGMDYIMTAGNLRRPPLVATLRYSAGIKTEALMRFGIFRITARFKRIFKKPPEGDDAEMRRSMAVGLRRLKRETRKTIVSHLKDYSENLKFMFLFKLVDLTHENIKELLHDRFENFSSEFSAGMDQINVSRADKQQAAELLQQLDQKSAAIKERLAAIRDKIEPAATPPTAPRASLRV